MKYGANGFAQVGLTLYLVAILFLIYVYWLRRRQSLDFLSKTKKPAVEFTFSDNEVQWRTELGSVQFDWKIFENILQSKALWLLLYARGSAYLTLPTNQVNETTLAFIKSKIVEKGNGKSA